MPDKLERHREGRVLLGRAIRARRKALDLSLTEVTIRTGLSSSALNAYELGRRLPPLDALDVVATALETSVRELLRDVWPWDDTSASTPG